ncbi:MAG: BNR repeat-containing protein [Pseudomonadota bacterium]
MYLKVLKHYWARLLLLTVFFFINGISVSVAEQRACAPLPDTLNVDRIWGGTSVRFGSVESASAIYIGYYDTQRWLAVSQIDKCTGHVKKVRLSSRFAGWDSHNYIAMALDKEGRVHIAGNMHVTPLVYARMSKPDDLESLQTLQPTTEANQSRTTYPRFFEFPDGALGLSYRDGQSGNGVEIIDRFDGTAWQRWLTNPLFGPSSVREHVNAYATDYIRGPDGYFHVAWVWRVNSNVETNFNINYARSKDLRAWETSKGKSLALPITPLNAEVVDVVPQGSGLFNNIKLGFDGDARPVISYLKFDAKAYTQLFHARQEINGWKVSQSTRWHYRWDPRGRGTIPSEISFSGLVWRDGMLVERITHPEKGNSGTFDYNVQSLAIGNLIKSFRWPDAIDVSRAVPLNTRLQRLAVKPTKNDVAPSFAITWASMPNDTRDLPRVCKPEVADCRYAFDLILHKLDKR